MFPKGMLATFYPMLGFLFGAVLLATSCGSNGDGQPSDGGRRDTAPTPDNGGPPPGKTLAFVSKQPLDPTYPGNAGEHMAIASHGAQMGVAYLRKVDPTTVPPVNCAPTATGQGGPEQGLIHDVVYVHFDGSDWGAPVVVDQTVGTTHGVSLIFDDDGDPHLGYLGGELSVQECYSSDAVIASSGNAGQSWQPRTVASTGVGDTVGYWPSLAVDCDGAVQITYRDVHFGYYEEDGNRRADWRFGASEFIATGDGDGLYTSLRYTPECNAVSVAYNPVKTGSAGGIRIALREGATWTVQQIVPLGVDLIPYPSFATDGRGLFGLAYYDPGDGSLYYTEASDLGSWPTPSLVDLRPTVHGAHTSLAFDSAGNPAVSYYRCASAGERNCVASQDALMFAYRIDGSWQTWVVDDGGNQFCGRYTALSFTPDDEPVIGYECVTFRNATQQWISAPKVARGVWQ